MSGDFVILLTADSPFAAHNVAAVLEEHGIEARVLDAADADVPMEGAYGGVPVMVARDALEPARKALADTGVDWDEVDVGEREDDLPLRQPGRMPGPARVTFVVAVVIAAIAVLGAAAVGLGII